MQVLNNNVLVAQDTAKETTTASGLILTADTSTGQKPAIVVGMSLEIANKKTIKAGDKIYFDWSKAMAVTLDGQQCAVIDYDEIKLIA